MPLKRLGHRVLGLVLAAMLLYGGLAPPVRNFFALPWQQRLPAAAPISLPWELPPGLARQVEVKVNSGDWSRATTGDFPGGYSYN